MPSCPFPAILILAFSFTNLREPMRRARPEAAHHPLSLKDSPREVARDPRARFRMNSEVKFRIAGPFLSLATDHAPHTSRQGHVGQRGLLVLFAEVVRNVPARPLGDVDEFNACSCGTVLLVARSDHLEQLEATHSRTRSTSQPSGKRASR